jgi:RNA methyltransferase, TrmH family
MISKARVKYIKSLQVKKYRREEQLFLVEGAKSVEELLRSDYVVTWVAATESFQQSHTKLLKARALELVTTSDTQLADIGTLQSNNGALAVAQMKANTAPLRQPGELIVVLDDIRDPGNLGTIIRTADWYGIKNIIASEETADFYNPKTISATMGSFCRMNIYYAVLEQYLSSVSGLTYGAYLQGENIHQKTLLKKGGHLVIGNESRGIAAELEKFIQHKITIPAFGLAESLNAGVATGIILDNFRRLEK